MTKTSTAKKTGAAKKASAPKETATAKKASAPEPTSASKKTSAKPALEVPAASKPAATKTTSAKPAAAAKTTSAKPAAAAKTTSAKPAAAAKTTSAKPAAAAKTTSAKPAATAKTTSAKPAAAAKTTSAKPAAAKTTSSRPPAPKTTSSRPPAPKTTSSRPPAPKTTSSRPPAPKPAAAKTTSSRPPPPKPPETPAVRPASDISIEDAKRILEDVRAGRKNPKGTCRAALPLSFTKPRQPSSVEQLNALERRQLVAAGADGMGEARTPEAWLDPDDESYYDSLEVWDVVDAKGTPAYSLWMYLTDNGTVFRANSIEVVGGVSQGAMECAEEGLEDALYEAKKRVDRALLQRSLLRFID